MKKAVKKKSAMSVNHNKSTMAGASHKAAVAPKGMKKKHPEHKRMH